jgi:hypothetical protein
MLLYGNAILVVAGLTALHHHGIPQALGFAHGPKQRFQSQQRYRGAATTALKQSSRPLFPRSPFQQDQKKFQDVRVKQKEKESAQAKPMPMENNIKFLQNSLVSGSVDRSTIVSTAASGLLAVLTVYGLLRTGRLVSFFRHASWWIQHAFVTYQSMLVNNPLGTKVGTGAALAILGDALAQSTTNRGAPYDKRRAVSFAVFDSCYRVFQHNMFPAVIKACQGNVVGLLGVAPALAAAIERTMVYQLMVVPVSYILEWLVDLQRPLARTQIAAFFLHHRRVFTIQFSLPLQDLFKD